MSIFADTAFYVAMLNPRDRLHRVALATSNSYRGAVVTTEYVLVELGNYLGGFSRRSFAGLLEDLRKDPKTEIVPSSSTLFEKGVRLYADRPDKRWSVTDCISFVVMDEKGISDVLSWDHHFEQAGFRLLMSAK